MELKTTIYDIYYYRYRNLTDVAHAMGISVSQIYRVYSNERNINHKFIIGAVKAFPDCKLDELFYITGGNNVNR